ncbi:MAG TPA: hypothetical protein VF574_03925 [Allosphingosinicella sp.]|jgi:hypothetical protein
MVARLDALGPTLLRLLAAPTPDLAALAVKIETIIAHEAFPPPGARIAWRTFAGMPGRRTPPFGEFNNSSI